MSDKSKIEWTDATWNPVRGCSRVSAGCTRCYAERIAGRFSGPGMWAEGLAENTPVGPRWTGRVVLAEDKLDQPLRWRTPRRVFVNSMSDLFHEGLSNEDIATVFGVMAACPQHTFQVLTKRPERMRDWFRWMADFAMEQRDLASAPSLRQTTMKAAFSAMGETDEAKRRMDPAWAGDGDLGPWPLPNVWLGVSAEDQASYDVRMPHLLQTPAAIRFISAEPLLGPIDMRMGGNSIPEYAPHRPWPKLDWLIVGGESGPGARPMHPDWARSLRDQCAAAGVAYFFKQWGEWAPTSQVITDGPTHAMTPLGTVAEFRREAMLEAAPHVYRWEGLRRVGKHAAGRLLDGREHNEFPGGAA